MVGFMTSNAANHPIIRMAPKECRVYKVLKTILCQGLREKMMFGFNTVIVQERASAGVCGEFVKSETLTGIEVK
jgi:hypothetical protein